jgi:hypothetical protein
MVLSSGILCQTLSSGILWRLSRARGFVLMMEADAFAFLRGEESVGADGFVFLRGGVRAISRLVACHIFDVVRI